jgi:hypothetical protein
MAAIKQYGCTPSVLMAACPAGRVGPSQLAGQPAIAAMPGQID